MTADRANAAAMVTGGGRMSPAISAIPLDPGIARMKFVCMLSHLSLSPNLFISLRRRALAPLAWLPRRSARGAVAPSGPSAREGSKDAPCPAMGVG